MSPPPRPPNRPKPTTPPAEADADLRAALEMVRRRGPIGERSLDAAIAHAERFVRAIPATARQVVDLGSGGGLPGLVVAARRGELSVTLVERRLSRADLLRRAVGGLGATGRVRVLAEDVTALARREPRSFDVATARSFGSPASTARAAAALLRAGGLLLVSEPPEDASGRWREVPLDDLGLADEGAHDGIRHLRRR